MNPQYKIHGNERRQLKKVLNEMKEYLEFLDTERDKLKVDIASLEIRLKERYETNKITK